MNPGAGGPTFCLSKSCWWGDLFRLRIAPIALSLSFYSSQGLFKGRVGVFYVEFLFWYLIFLFFHYATDMYDTDREGESRPGLKIPGFNGRRGDDYEFWRHRLLSAFLIKLYEVSLNNLLPIQPLSNLQKMHHWIKRALRKSVKSMLNSNVWLWWCPTPRCHRYWKWS